MQKKNPEDRILYVVLQYVTFATSTKMIEIYKSSKCFDFG